MGILSCLKIFLAFESWAANESETAAPCHKVQSPMWMRLDSILSTVTTA